MEDSSQVKIKPGMNIHHKLTTLKQDVRIQVLTIEDLLLNLIGQMTQVLLSADENASGTKANNSLAKTVNALLVAKKCLKVTRSRT